jgi:hypothetical protein
VKQHWTCGWVRQSVLRVASLAPSPRAAPSDHHPHTTDHGPLARRPDQGHTPCVSERRVLRIAQSGVATWGQRTKHSRRRRTQCVPPSDGHAKDDTACRVSELAELKNRESQAAQTQQTADSRRRPSSACLGRTALAFETGDWRESCGESPGVTRQTRVRGVSLSLLTLMPGPRPCPRPRSRARRSRARRAWRRMRARGRGSGCTI